MTASSGENAGGVLFLPTAALGIVVALVLARWIATEPETTARSMGGILQLLGVMVVGYEISVRRRKFGLPPVVDLLVMGGIGIAQGAVSLMGRLFSKPPDVREGRSSVSAVAGIGSISGRGAMHSFDLEARLGRIERRLAEVDEKIDTISSELVADIRRIDEAAASEMEARIQKDQELEEKIGDLALGSMQAELVGWIWVGVGLALSAWAPEVSSSRLFS